MRCCKARDGVLIYLICFLYRCVDDCALRVAQHRKHLMSCVACAGVNPAQQRCLCDVPLTMRMCTKGPNRGRLFYTCKQRNEDCKDIFLWADGEPSLKAEGTSSSAPAGAAPNGGTVALTSQGTAAAGSMRERLQKRGRSAALSGDMSADGVAARELKTAMCDVAAKSGGRSGDSGSTSK